MRLLRRTLLGAATILVLGIGWDATRRRPAARPPLPEAPPLPKTVERIWTGSASCAGQSCHGGTSPRAGSSCRLNEASIVSSDDKHARAFDVLLEERSKAMALATAGTREAHRLPRCLACHATPFMAKDYSSAEASYGVGCESCHGPAAKWIGPHAVARPERDPCNPPASWIGFVNLCDMPTRAKVCAGCHVGGTGDRNVDHDLIAAGHPRLMFEFVSLQDAMPAHWRPRKDRDPPYEWFVGQVQGAKATLTVTRERIDGRTWPEFAEYDCYACHHDLKVPSWRQDLPPSKSLGKLTWNSWTADVIPRLLALHGLDADAWPKLAAGMQHLGPPDRPKLRGLVDAADKSLVALAGRAEHWRGRQGQLASLLKHPGWVDDRSWESNEQLFFALRAFHLGTGDAEAGKRWAEIEPRRGLAPGFLSPRNFERQPIEKK